MDGGRDSSISSSGKWKSILFVVMMTTAGFAAIISYGDGGSLPSDGLLVHYSFDEGEGQVAGNSAGSEMDLQLGGSSSIDGTDPDWSPGILNSSLEFDGVDDFAICYPFDLPETEFSLMFWVNIPDSFHESFAVSYAVEEEDNEVLIGFREQIHIEIDWPEQIDIPLDIRDGKWHHFAMTWENTDGDIAVYTDGAEEYTGTMSQGVSVIAGGALVLGYEQDDVAGGFEGNQGLVGRMDEFAIYNTYLSSSDIASIYTSYDLPVSGLETIPGSGYIDLLWDEVDDPALKHYNIYRADPEDVKNGLLGEYFDNMNLTDPKLTRVDQRIEFDFGRDPPHPSMDGETFSISWSGYLRAENSISHDIYTTSNDGVRLWLDGALVIDDWNNHASKENSASVYLERGYHRIRMDYYDNTLEGSVKLEWESSHTPRMVIPSGNLFTFNMTDLEKIGSVDADNYRDSGLETDLSYFYYVTYEKNDGTESPISDIVGQSPSFSTTLEVYPAKKQATVGATLEFSIKVKNDGRVADWFELSIVGLDGWDLYFSENELYLSPREWGRSYLTVTILEGADEGLEKFQVVLDSRLNSISQSVDTWIDVSLEPVIHDLLPYDDFRSGSMNVLFSWRTELNCSTEVYLREEGVGDYNKYEGPPGFDHALVIPNLERRKTYEYYVVTASSRGSTSSPVRTFEVTTGLVFQENVFGVSIDRDYYQSMTVTVRNLDEIVHRFRASIENPYDDLVVGFVGSGSMDSLGSITPGNTARLELVLHAQDAMRHRYDLMLNLTTVPDFGEEPMQAYAIVRVTLNHLFVNMTLTELSTDPYKLSKTIRITNDDDPVTDVRVFAQAEYADALDFEPSIEHGLLKSGESVEIVVSPKLHFAFVPFSAKIFVSAYDRVFEITLDFEPPEDWDVFAASIFPNWGGLPFVDIDPDDIDMDGISNGEDDDIDGDGLLNIEELFLTLDTDNDGIPNQLDLDDDGDGNPDVSDLWRIDFDNDYLPNYADNDRDGDGVDNSEDDHPDDHDNDGEDNGRDHDDDNDRVDDEDDYHPQDHDNDGENDGTDTDDDSDGQEDPSDPHPYDQDNDGTPDVSDPDWKGGGTADPSNPAWNPNPGPGGSPGSWGGGGSSDSSEGNDWYCTNKPELSWWELLLKLAQLGLLAWGIASIFIGATPVGMFVNFIFFVGEWSLKEAAKMGAKSLFGNELREDVARYYPEIAQNSSRAPNALIVNDIAHFYWHAEDGDHVQIMHQWSDPLNNRVGKVESLTTSSADSRWPSMEADDLGRLYLTWVDHRDGNGEVYFKMSADGGGNWGQEIRITNSAGDADDPDIVVDSGGKVHITWVDTRNGNEEVYYSHSDDKMTWSPPMRMTNTAGNSTRPILEIDGDDDAHMVWAESSGASSGIQYVKSVDRGNSWTSPVVISPEGDNAGEPTMEITEGGIIHVAWRDSREDDSEIYYRKSLDLGSSWENEVRITDDESYSEYPHLVAIGEDISLFWHDDHTGMDLTYFRNHNASQDSWTLMKRLPSGSPRVDRIQLELEMHPDPASSKEIKPHDVYLMFDDMVIGSIINEIPDGIYTFDIPLDLISMAAGSLYDHELKLVTRHMNPGHYVVNSHWKLSWHSVSDFEYLFAPDQYSADEYLRRNVSVEWLTEDPALYSNHIHISEDMPEVGDIIQITAGVMNPGGDVAENVEVRFYEMEPGNESRRIGDPVVIEHIGQYGMVSVSVNWTAVKDVSRIYAVVDPLGSINELDERNNQAYARVTVIEMIPPQGAAVLNDGSPFTSSKWVQVSFDSGSANEITHVSFSNDNSTWSDWLWITESMSWDLERGIGTRSYAEGDGVRTLYVRFKDVVGLISDVTSAEIQLFSHAPTILSFSGEDGVIGKDEVLSIEFSNPMDEDSVREALLISPAIDGSFSWDNRTFTFIPQGDWTVGETYNLSITTDAGDFANRRLESLLFWEFTVSEGGGDDDVDDDDETDTDGDGMPDWWEDQFGLNRTDPDDAEGDLDNDGISNLDEFQGGSDPTDPQDLPADDDDVDTSDSNIGWILGVVIAIVILFLIIFLVIFFVARSAGGKKEDWEE